MLLKALAAAAAVPAIAASASAGVYTNMELESNWRGNDYSGSQIETRVGYDHAVTEDASVYLEVGPTVLMEDGEDSDTRLGVEVGGEVGITEQLSLYGEVEMLTGPQNDYGTKVGATFRF